MYASFIKAKNAIIDLYLKVGQFITREVGKTEIKSISNSSDNSSNATKIKFPNFEFFYSMEI